MPLKTPLRFGLPKGSLEQSTFRIARPCRLQSPVVESWLQALHQRPRASTPVSSDPQEMSRYVAQGFLDFGITGKDWIQESGHQGRSHVRPRLQQGHRASPPAGSSPFRKTPISRASATSRASASPPSSSRPPSATSPSITSPPRSSSPGAPPRSRSPSLVDAIVDLDRNRLLPPRQQAPHRRDHHRELPPIDRQSRPFTPIPTSARSSKTSNCSSSAPSTPAKKSASR